MQNMLKSKVFWSASIIAAVLIFLAGINLDKNYKSEVKILFTPKSQIAATNIGRIIQDAKEIFLLREKNAEIKTDRKSDIVRVSAKGTSRIETGAQASKAARGIAAEMSRYYNIKSDLDIRIIDGPVTKQGADVFSGKWILIALILGLASGIFIDFFQSVNFSSRKTTYAEFVKPSIFEAPKESERKFETAPGRKAAAPENLPIDEEFVLPVKKSEEKKEEELEAAVKKAYEATPEEVKERLNKLLRGEM